MAARDSLTVFVAGDEVPGLIVYALHAPGAPSLDWPVSDWPVDREPTSFRLHGDQWEVVGWDVAMQSWPLGREWRGAVRTLFDRLIAGGAVIAWLGAEGCPFADPPDLFAPEHMTGGVLAAATQQGEFFCPLDPERPVEALGPGEMAVLRDRARGLADVP
ncbi:hypothetical protein [Nocardioides korecus]